MYKTEELFVSVVGSPGGQKSVLRCSYLAFTAHLVALAEALLLGVAQGVPGHDVIAQGDVHAPAGLGLACKRSI